MKQIPLTQGKFAIVDDEDFDFLSQFSWRAFAKKQSRTFYARGWVRTEGFKQDIFMHRVVLNFSKGLIDHRDGDGLNNTKQNLRECTPSLNLINSKTPRNNTSGFKGVCWRGERKKWRARCSYGNKENHLGYFDNKIEAAKAYDKFVLENFGEFARLNFPV